MQDQQPFDNPIPENEHASRRFPTSVVAALSALVLAAGVGTAWWSWNNLQSPSDQAPVDTGELANPDTPTTTNPDQTPGAVDTNSAAQVYLLTVAEDRFELAPSSIQLDTSAEPSVALTTAFKELLATAPSESGPFSAIPENTELLDLTVESDGVHVDLSSDFQFGGGSASMMGRLAQVIYTASSLEPTTSVWISVDGEPLEVLGGEGLIVDQPMTRAQFEENFSL
ncbi:MAG: GerMN domain-containing protein [Leptolyngbyaceae bacterium]|nr:GerMN domain-containing protein [Leptolyngbyaceae bacterium]